MRYRGALSSLVVIVLVVSLAAGQAAAKPAPGPTLPPVRGTALNGDAVLLPEGLHGKASVLVAGFSQSARGQVTEWGRRLAAEYRSSPTVLYYELPMISGVPRLLRGWVVGKIRDDTPDRARSRIVPVTDHESEWRAAAGYQNANDAYVMVVSPAGRLLWRGSGQPTDALFLEVKHQVELASQR